MPETKAAAPLEIYRILPRNNCGKCLLPSCLAFAAAVAAGQKKLCDCPDISPALLAKMAGICRKPVASEIEQAGFVDKLQRRVTALDLAAIAPVIGAVYRDNGLVVNSLGKDFIVDARGNLNSECHLIPWVQIPLLAYITNKTHGEITGSWISFREIKGGIDWQGLFTSRCETPLRKLADANPALLEDLIDLFMGQAIDWYQADIALILHPLPHIPILICYQAPEEDMESALTIFFDRCCGQNLHIKAIFTLCSGLVQMFTKIAERHLFS
ncbi:MAG: DUF3786 domain-containing protein [Deltaproteobacteria bacterium]|nr:DUF3786 domain-containing protein [Deltaproteobacteria bacterium]